MRITQRGFLEVLQELKTGAFPAQPGSLSGVREHITFPGKAGREEAVLEFGSDFARVFHLLLLSRA